MSKFCKILNKKVYPRNKNTRSGDENVVEEVESTFEIIVMVSELHVCIIQKMYFAKFAIFYD